jgi:hypothetical protein
MIYALITEKERGVMSEDQAAQLGNCIFPCGHCSAPDITVFHNVIGHHMHIPIEDKAIAHAEIRVCANGVPPI